MKQSFAIQAILAAAVCAGPVQAQDWGGFYAGLSVTSADSELDFPGLPSPYTSNDGAALGIYAGYNHVLASNIVIGGELSYADLKLSDFPLVPWSGDGLTQLRGRVGYAAGNVMPYLAVGVAKTDFSVIGGPSTSESGLSLGVGAEFLVNDNMSLRAEYSRVKFKSVGENVLFPPDFADFTYETMTIGAAWHF